MAMCGEMTSFTLTWCVLPEGHAGGHRGVVMVCGEVERRPAEVVLAWSEGNADPIVVGVR